MRVLSLGREDSLEEENGNPLQYCCLKKSCEQRGAWKVIVHGASKSQIQLSNTHTHTHTHTYTHTHTHQGPSQHSFSNSPLSGRGDKASPGDCSSF